jgi:hypothetical protein
VSTTCARPRGSRPGTSPSPTESRPARRPPQSCGRKLTHHALHDMNPRPIPGEQQASALLSSGAESAGRAPPPGLTFPHLVEVRRDPPRFFPLRSSTRSQIGVRADPTGALIEDPAAPSRPIGTLRPPPGRARRARLSLSPHSVSRQGTGDPATDDDRSDSALASRGPSRGDECGNAGTRLWPARTVRGRGRHIGTNVVRHMCDAQPASP